MNEYTEMVVDLFFEKPSKDKFLRAFKELVDRGLRITFGGGSLTKAYPPDKEIRDALPFVVDEHAFKEESRIETLSEIWKFVSSGKCIDIKVLPSFYGFICQPDVWQLNLTCFVNENNERLFLDWITGFSEVFQVKIGGAVNHHDIDYVPITPTSRPMWCEWILVLGPELKKYININKVKRKFDMINLEYGGLLIHEDIMGLHGEVQIRELTSICKELPRDLSFLWLDNGYNE